MIDAWLATSLVRHYPRSPSRPGSRISLELPLNQSGSCQVAVRNEAAADTEPTTLTIAAEAESLDVQVRRVGYVPMRHRNQLTPDNEAEGGEHIPGFVPDPLLENSPFPLPGGETHAWWLTFRPRDGAAPGAYPFAVRISPEGRRARILRGRVIVHNLRVEPRRDFTVTTWMHHDCLFHHHGLDGFDERFWSILPNYLANLAAHHHNAVSIPLLTPALDGVRRPQQLLRVRRTGKDRYRFDWRDVGRYLGLLRRHGIKPEWPHLFTQWGAKHALRVYENDRDNAPLWPPETSAVGESYRRFLAQLLPEFHQFLRRERRLGDSIFHVSDEPHADRLESYRAARGLIRELAPWMKTADALSDIAYARAGLVDIPIACTSTALDFIREDLPCWVYYCCGPQGRFPNRLLDTPLVKIRIQGWLFYRWPFGGFLHWGYNYWNRSDPVVRTSGPLDPYAEQDAGMWPAWPAGDPFVVYPGRDAPVDSLRWEVLAEGLADYALLQTAGMDREDPLLRPLASLEDYPRDESWLLRLRKQVLRSAASRS